MCHKSCIDFATNNSDGPKLRRIRYSGLSDSIEVRVPAKNWTKIFCRNTFEEVPSEIAQMLLKKRYWLPAEFSLREYLADNPVARISMQRKYGLGDVIQLVPVVRAIRKQYPEVWIALLTDKRVVDFAQSWAVFDMVISADDYHRVAPECNLSLVLDAVLEMDRSGGIESRMIRIDHYHHWLGTEGLDTTCDWRLGCDSKALKWAKKQLKELPEPRIGLQVKGSHLIKTLPFATIEYIADSLLDKGYMPVLLDNKRAETKNKQLVNLTAETDLFQLQAIIDQLHMVITMDSSILWLAHTQGTPVIALLGPTRIQERITLHPLYPEGAGAVLLNEMIGCPSCFERMTTCEGKIGCMNLPTKEDIFAAIMGQIQLIIESNKTSNTNSK